MSLLFLKRANPAPYTVDNVLEGVRQRMATPPGPPGPPGPPAAAPQVDVLQGLQERQTQTANRELLPLLARYGLFAAGAGVGLRGLQGLYSMLRPKQQKPTPESANIVTIPSRNKAGGLQELANQGYENIANLGRKITNSLVPDPSGLAPSAPSLAAPRGPQDTLLHIPGLALAGAGGLYGGWKLLDTVLDANRKSQYEADVARAKQEYEDALNSQYTGKAASGEPTLGAALDQLYDLVKSAELSWGDVARGAGGVGVTAAGLLALASGAATYNVMKRRTPQAVLRRALEQRRFDAAANQPPQIYMLPEEHDKPEIGTSPAPLA